MTCLACAKRDGLRQGYALPEKSPNGRPGRRHRTPRGYSRASRSRETTAAIRLTCRRSGRSGCPWMRLHAVQRFLRPGAVGEIRRRRLIAGRRLGQRFPRRLALERGRLGLVAAEQTAEAAGVAELRRAEDRIVGNTGLHRIVVGAGLGRGLADIEFARGQDAGGFDGVAWPFLRAAIAALRRASSGSFGQFGSLISLFTVPAAADRAWEAPPAAIARDSRCRGSPCWCRRCRP